MSKPRIFATLSGGFSYAPADKADEFPSVAAVAQEWQNRKNYGRSSDGLGTPCWGDGIGDYLTPGERATIAFVWLVYPNTPEADDVETIHECSADLVLTIGPRGGIRTENA